MTKQSDSKAERSSTGTRKRSAPVPRNAKAKSAEPIIRPNSKIAKVVEMMRKPGGATLKAIMGATDWQAHSVRGAISGAIGKKLGFKVISEMHGDARVYRIAG